MVTALDTHKSKTVTGVAHGMIRFHPSSQGLKRWGWGGVRGLGWGSVLEERGSVAEVWKGVKRGVGVVK